MLLKYLKHRVRNYCAKKYRLGLKISQCPFMPNFNGACHWNTDAMRRRGECEAIAECVMINSDSATLHYVAVMRDKTCCDPTLGDYWQNADYRLIRLTDVESDPYETLVRVKREIARAAGVPNWVISLYGPHALL